METANHVARSAVEALRERCSTTQERITRLEAQVSDVREELGQLRGELRTWLAVVALATPLLTALLGYILRNL